MLTSFFTTSLSLFKSTGTGINLSISNSFTSAFKLAKSDFAASLDVSIPVAYFKPAFDAYLDQSTLKLMSPPDGSYGLGKY